MSLEDFEKKLKQRPMRPVPAEWRAEILAAAKAAACASSRDAARKTAPLFIISSYLSNIFCLRPGALAGLAAAWALILIFHLSTHDGSSVTANSAPVSQEVITQVREQRLFYAEMVGLPEPRDVEPRKAFLSRPRSEGRCRMMTA